MRRFIFLFILFFGISGFAAPLCGDVFAIARVVPTLQDLALQAPEIEAKFLIPNQATYESLKSLSGNEIVINDSYENPVRYKVEKNKEHIYEDINYDTKDLSLFQRRGMLRERTRYDLDAKEGSYKLNKVVFQAKDGPADNQGMQEAVYARNEVRGKEYKNKKKFEKKKDKKLGDDSDDLAVQFARDYSQSDKKFKPILSIVDVCYFLKLTPIEGNTNVPWFYVSLDNVTYEGLKGRKGKASRLELEAEIGDDLTLDTNEAIQHKLILMDSLTEYLAAKFSLKASPESKYESGVRLTVLED